MAAAGVPCACLSLMAALLGPWNGATQVDPASRAVMYLESQQSSVNGGLPGGAGPSALYAVDAAVAGFDPTAIRNGGPSVMSDLEAGAAASCGTAGTCGELLQAAAAAGEDPHSFGGVDLVAALMHQYVLSTGAFGDGEAFTEALAVQGLVAAGAPVPPGALTFLHRSQDSDGGWNYLDSRNAAAGSDTNSTAMVLMALDAAGDHSLDASGLHWLHTQQDSDGGFPYQAGFGTDPDSTALVVQTIVGTGGDPRSAAWTVAEHSPYEDLVASQAPDGGYTFPGNSGPDAFTTVQVPPALALEAFPVRTVFARDFTPSVESSAALGALRYLAAQLAASGAFTGTASDDSSALFVIGTAAAGFDPNTLRAPSGTAVVTHLATDAATSCGAASSAGLCGRLIQAAAAAGEDPHSFGGVDLVAALMHQYVLSTGTFGDGEAFTEALAVQGLVAAGAPVPPGALTFLHRSQDSDGGWNYLDSRNAAAGSDTNSTAMVLMALDAAGDHSLDASGLHWLHTQQDSDGGFPYQAGFGTDPDSTALVVQAITAADDAVSTASWAPHGVTPLMELVASQQAGGGYTFPGNGAPDVLTTAQVPVALERAAFPVPFTSRPFYTPGSTLGQVAPAPSPAPAPTHVPAGIVHNSTSPATASSTAAPSASAAGPAAARPAAGPSVPPAAATIPAPPSHPRAPVIVEPARTPPLPLLYALAGVCAAALAAGGSLLILRRR